MRQWWMEILKDHVQHLFSGVPKRVSYLVVSDTGYHLIIMILKNLSLCMYNNRLLWWPMENIWFRRVLWHCVAYTLTSRVYNKEGGRVSYSLYPCVTAVVHVRVCNILLLVVYSETPLNGHPWWAATLYNGHSPWSPPHWNSACL